MTYGRHGQNTFRGWFVGAPHPVSGPMSKAERDWWLELIMRDVYFPAVPKQVKRIAYGAGSEPREERSGTLISRLVDK